MLLQGMSHGNDVEMRVNAASAQIMKHVRHFCVVLRPQQSCCGPSTWRKSKGFHRSYATKWHLLPINRPLFIVEGGKVLPLFSIFS